MVADAVREGLSGIRVDVGGEQVAAVVSHKQQNAYTRIR
jgi:hypothetical protein